MWAVIFAIKCVDGQACHVAHGRVMLLSERCRQDQCAQENYGKAPDERCHDEGAMGYERRWKLVELPPSPPINVVIIASTIR